MIGFILLIFGRALFGWCNYFDVNGRKDGACVAVRCFHVFWIPLFPLEALVVFDPSPSIAACCGKARCVAFKTTCNKFLWKAFGWAWLRFFTFGLLSCWHPQASDTQEIMEAIGILRNNAAANTAPSSSSSSGNTAPQPVTGVPVDNKEAYYNSYTPTETDNRNATV